jgi:pyridoxamine 5'-phosphate oxidase
MDLYAEALDKFRDLFRQVHNTDLPEPTAMVLATADAHGRPSARSVLLKGLDERGFVFYTNYRSRKGQELTANPRAALCFFWQPLMQQVQVEGRVETVSEAEADAYWQTRDRLSQLGGWASQQSEPLPDRAVLEERFTYYTRHFTGRPVSRPPHWSGYRVIPERIEFWKAMPHRLHERICYQKGEHGWIVTLLNP